MVHHEGVVHHKDPKNTKRTKKFLMHGIGVNLRIGICGHFPV